MLGIPTNDGAGELRFIAWPYRLMMFFSFSTMAGVILSTLTLEQGLTAFVVIAVLALLAVTVALRSWVLGRIDLDSQGVVFRSFVKTTRIYWRDIRTVYIGQGRNVFLIPWRVPYFELKDGSVILADDFRTLRKKTVVDEVVAEANRRLSAQH